MNSREKFSVILVSMGIILIILPLTSGRPITVKPDKLLSEVLSDSNYLSVDQIARMVVREDSTIQLIDLRSPEQFRNMNIPGSVNIPYTDIIEKDHSTLFSNGKSKYILYSNGDLNANYALVLLKGLKYKNTYVMQGGLNEWYNTVMNSQFTGERITARENAIFEIRKSARDMFTQINSLPDSVKQQYIMAKNAALKKLDGGCE